MKKNKKKQIGILLLILVIVILSTLFAYKKYTESRRPAELIKLIEEIEAKNANKNFDLDYEYTGPNTTQPLPFNKD
jgi:uncharacterized protein YpmB